MHNDPDGSCGWLGQTYTVTADITRISSARLLYVVIVITTVLTNPLRIHLECITQ